ncbi:MAG: hypothetical protein PHI59_05810 [Candidatus Omnitrophica bacterium]|nr:hypothetical protein [Candidatus Omnitrophota bacterium]
MRKIVITSLLILLVPAVCCAEYMKLTSGQKEKWTKPRAIAEVEKAARNNTAVDYLGRMSEDKLKYIKEYGCPDVIGRYNARFEETGEKIEEWLYYAPAKYVYFHEKSGEIWKEEPLTELDKVSAAGKVETGMNEMQVMRAKGAPSHIEREQNAYGAEEKWVYGSMYIWLKGGKVVHCQK